MAIDLPDHLKHLEVYGSEQLGRSMTPQHAPKRAQFESALRLRIREDAGLGRKVVLAGELGFVLMEHDGKDWVTTWFSRGVGEITAA